VASGNHWWMKVPKNPPVMAPRKSEGAKTPPDPPEPTVTAVARILATISTPSSETPRSPVRAGPMVL